MKKQTIWLGVYILLLLVLMNIKIDHELPYDQGRHANQAHVFYNYYRNILHGNFMSFENFVDQYNEKQRVGFYAWKDPPFAAMVTGFMFLLFGAGEIVARLATELFFIIAIIYCFRISSKVLKKFYLAMASTIIFSMIPMVFLYARQVMLPVPAVAMILVWYYHFIYAKPRNLSLKLGPNSINIELNNIIAGLALTFATLVKYQNIAFAGIFAAVYAVVLFIMNKSYQDISKFFSTDAWNIIRKFMIQLVIFFVISFRWIQVSLFDKGILKQILWEGTAEGKEKTFEWAFYFVKQLGFETFFISILALIPIIWLFLKKDRLLKENYHILIYVLVVLIVGSILISNRQLRYLIGMLPFVIIMAVMGLHYLVKSKKVFIGISSVIIAFMLFFSLASAYIVIYNAYGEIDREAFDYISGHVGQKLILNLEFGYDTFDMVGGPYQIAAVSLSRALSDELFGTEYADWPGFRTNRQHKNFFEKAKQDYRAANIARYRAGREMHSYSPDTFIFNTLLLEDDYDPEKMSTYSNFFASAMVFQNTEQTFAVVKDYSTQIKTFVVVSNMGSIKENYNLVSDELEKKGFEKKEFRYYDVWE